MFALLWGLVRASPHLVIGLLVVSGSKYSMIVRLRQAVHWQGESPPKWIVLCGPLALSVSCSSTMLACSGLLNNKVVSLLSQFVA